MGLQRAMRNRSIRYLTARRQFAHAHLGAMAYPQALRRGGPRAGGWGRTSRLMVVLVLGSCACPGSPPSRGSQAAQRPGDREDVHSKRSTAPSGAPIARPEQTPPSSLADTASLVDTAPLVDPADVALGAFYERLRRLARGDAAVVRVMHWGDSHVAAESMTSRLRALFQQRFGDAGPGFVLAGQPWRSYRHLSVRGGVRGDWRVERLYSRYGRRKPRPRDDLLGVAGVSISARPLAHWWLEPVGLGVTRVELYYLRQPAGGQLRLVAPGYTGLRLSTRAATKVGSHERVELGHPVRRLELDISQGEVRLYGIDLQTGRPGVLYDALGINGAAASSQLSWNESLMAEQVERLGPALVVLAYGSNELDAPNLTREMYAESLTTIVQRTKRVAPAAACLLVGPPDQARLDKATGEWAAPERLSWIIAEQRRVALGNGCAFWHQQEAMGGPGSIFAWRAEVPPLARADHLHFTAPGYQRLGEALFDALIRRAVLDNTAVARPKAHGAVD